MDSLALKEQTQAWDKRRRAATDLMKDGEGNLTPDARAFMVELQRFSGWGDTPFRDTERETCRVIGRQEVLTHIAMLLDMELEALYKMFTDEAQEDVFT